MIIRKRISERYNHPIGASKAGLVAIFVSARCRSKGQIESNVDEDLRVEIDGLRFREIPPEKREQLFNIPPALNGSRLKGLKKQEIMEVVRYWNNYFSKQKYPPSEFLDPNIVKAMIYLESRFGYYEPPAGYYPAYPDVIQIADERNPAIHTLNNDGWVDPKTKQIAREYELNDKGKLWLMDYQGKANGKTVEQSIYWGVRWLYHKAQYLVETKPNKFIRRWNKWEEAVANYNKKDNWEYQKKVYQIYRDGTDPQGNILWQKSKNQNSLRINLLLFLFIGLIGLIFYLASREISLQESTQIAEASKDIYQEIDELMSQKFNEYQKSHYYYGDIFKSVVDRCQKDKNCRKRVVFNKYIDDLVSNMHSNKQFIEAMISLSLLDNGAWEHLDINNDGENEILFLHLDDLNREYIEIFIIDYVNNKFKLLSYKIDEYYYNSADSIIMQTRPLKIRELTGDNFPEILVFANKGRYGSNLHILQYVDYKIKEVAIINNFVYPIYTFFDQDNDGILEIKVVGENPCAYHALIPECENMLEKALFKYNILKNTFKKIESNTP